MTTQIHIESYLSQAEIKQIVSDQVADNVAAMFKDEKNAQRLLSNLSYEMVFAEVEKIIPNHKQEIINKVSQIIKKPSSYGVFRERSSYSPESLATKYLNNAVANSRDLINQKVKETIENADYSEKIWNKFEELGESFISNIYSIVELGRSKKKD